MNDYWLTVLRDLVRSNGDGLVLLLNGIVALMFVLALSIFWQRLTKQVKTQGITAIELALGLALVIGIPTSVHRVLSWTVVTIATSSSNSVM
jgi:hypothetical protein